VKLSVTRYINVFGHKATYFHSTSQRAPNAGDFKIGLFFP